MIKKNLKPQVMGNQLNVCFMYSFEEVTVSSAAIFHFFSGAKAWGAFKLRVHHGSFSLFSLHFDTFCYHLYTNYSSSAKHKKSSLTYLHAYYDIFFAKSYDALVT